MKELVKKNKKRIIALLVLVIFIGILPKAAYSETNNKKVEYIDIKDRNLKDELEKAIQKVKGNKVDNNNSNKISKNDMSLITNLDIKNKGIKNIQGLEFATNLESINLEGNEVRDISSLRDIKGLKNINAKNQKIKLEDFNVSSESLTISNPIIGLDKNTNINILGKNISVKDNKITINKINSNKEIKLNFKDKKLNELFSGNISFNVIMKKNINLKSTKADEVNIPDEYLRKELNFRLGQSPNDPISKAQMETFTKLTINGNNIVRLNGLEAAKNLTKLNLNNNRIIDISSLETLRKLTEIDLGGNALKDISSLANLTRLEVLNLSFNQISDISPLKNLRKLQSATIEDQSISGPRIESIGSKATTDNIVKGIKGEFVNILNGSDYKYNSSTHKITFSNITSSTNKSYNFNIGRFTLPSSIVGGTFSGTVSQQIKYVPRRPVDIPDINLKAALNSKLHQGADENIFKDQLNDLTGTLDLNNKQIKIIEGLQYCTSISNLYLYSNNIDDLTPLSGLINLRSLNLNNNRDLSDISPLYGLNLLRDLKIADNKVTANQLLNLPDLEVLDYRRNKVSDISPLSGLTKLTNLNLQGNQISNISPLSGLTKLTNLDLQENQINNINPLLGLINLTNLTLDNQYIRRPEVTSVGNIATAYNIIYGVDGSLIAPAKSSDYDYVGDKVQFKNITSDGDKAYTFNKNVTIGSATGTVYSGRVTQKVVYDQIIDIPDVQFKAVLNRNIYSSTDSSHDRDPITLSQLKGLTHIERYNVSGIQNLEGIQYCDKLTVLRLNDEEISDLSLLSTLDELSTISLIRNKISDVSPLSGLNKVSKLQLDDQKITGIEVTSIGHKATVDNIIKDLNNQFVNIGNNTNYDYDATNHKVLFKNINSTGKQAYDFNTKVILGSAKANFNGTVTQNVIYEPGVNIPDSNLRAALNEILVQTPSTSDITQSQLEGLRGRLTLSNKNISNIEGLQYCINIEGLDLRDNNIRDIKTLAKLTTNKLGLLDISENPIKYVPDLSNLTILRTFRAEDCNIGDIDSLTVLSDLRELNLSGNKISEVGQLNRLSKLNYLNLNSNNIKNITSIKNLNELTYLNLGNNQVDDVSSLSSLNKLITLIISDNNIGDISPIKNIIDTIQGKSGDFEGLGQVININESNQYNIGSEYTLENIVIGKNGGKEPAISILPRGSYNSTTGEITWNGLNDSMNDLSYSWQNDDDKFSGTVNVKIRQITDPSVLIEIPSKIKMEDLQDENAPDIDPTNRPGVKPTVYNMVGATTPIKLISDPSIPLQGNFKIYTDPIFRISSVSNSSNYVPVSVYKDFNTRLTNPKDPLMTLNSSNKENNFIIKATKSEFKGSYDKYAGTINFTIDYSK
ncbi:leucine-rich repeat domain-containing protein [Clostridium sardiniense]|uniref:Leucine-rich repeat domain-containing protein n=1 Tax=Clostridium sardiniense TaxID=29369 RepID=A0ABS7L2C0_CLOSR|nr:leucine-rich repeat domain-containing protein [Clostridium sardiniense]MBY0757210.1 leucine-rich repeat domain-containing protein [Clostridium sardiniense]MDQ0462055.1 Leucine-rich repeat (LRR) protein [Clostridium sardiniense]